MKTIGFKFEAWQMVFVIVASAFAVVFLNSIAFGFSSQTLVDSVSFTFFIASFVCAGILFLAPRICDYSLSKRILIITIAIFVGTVVGIYFGNAFVDIRDNFKLDNSVTPRSRTFIFSLVISYTFGFSTYFYMHSQNLLRQTEEILQKKELSEAHAKSLIAEAQLASIESRIHPHFLFNTLNSIAALIKENPNLAEQMVEKLSALLRYSLDFDSNSLVKLKGELKITKDYLEIESARFVDKLGFDISIGKGLENEKLPAFALQTLVENSIKHVASKRSAKTEIQISVTNGGGNLKIEVSDNGFGFSELEIKPGHGLDNLQSRLKNIYGKRAVLTVIENESMVRLIIPLDQ